MASNSIQQIATAGDAGYQPSETQTSSSATQPPLSGVLSSTTVPKLKGTSTFRRYAGQITLDFPFNGRVDSHSKSTLYEVGSRNVAPADLLQRAESDAGKLSQPFSTTDVVSTELSALHKKFSNFSGTYQRMDLSGLLAQLARGLAVFSITGKLSAQDIRGGRPISIRALATLDAPASVSDSMLFIPRCVSVQAAPATFVAMVAAANAHGCQVVTDVLALSSSNAPHLPAYSDSVLALGCVYGIRVIVAMMDKCQAGAIAALAVTKGIHDILTVVGHTDEGGVMRAVLRKGDFRQPYGGIYPDFAAGFMGIPSPERHNPAGFGGLVDAIALKSAGLTALADPLINIKGRWYPTVLNAEDGPIAAPGANEEGTDADAVCLASQLASVAPAFAENYVRQLGWLFNTHGGEDIAASFMCQQFDMLVNTADRHLKLKVAAPFYWVEPTTLFDTAPESFADSQGYGLLSSNSCGRQMPWFDGQAKLLSATPTRARVAVGWRSARTCGALLHSMMHPRDGLAHYIPTQFVAEKMLLKGGSQPVWEARASRQGLDEYTWGRGQCEVPAPAEMLYIGDVIGFEIVLSTYQEDRWSYKASHVPTVTEMFSSMISIRSCKPEAIPVGKLLSLPRQINRARSLAGVALDVAREAVYGAVTLGDDAWGAFNCEPSIFVPQGEVSRGTFIAEQAEGTPNPVPGMENGRPVSVSRQDRPIGATDPTRATRQVAPTISRESSVVAHTEAQAANVEAGTAEPAPPAQ